MQWIRWFRDLGIADVPSVGGKNASLGEMLRELSAKGIRIPDGYAITAQGYREFLRHNQLEEKIDSILAELDVKDVNDLLRRTGQIRRLILLGEFPESLEHEIVDAYQH